MPNWTRLLGVATLAVLLAFGGVAGATMDAPRTVEGDDLADEVVTTGEAPVPVEVPEEAVPAFAEAADEAPVEMPEESGPALDEAAADEAPAQVAQRSVWAWTVEEIEALRELAVAHLAEKSGQSADEVEARLAQELEAQRQEAFAHIESMQEKWAEMRDAAIEKWEAVQSEWEQAQHERRDARHERRTERAKRAAEPRAVVQEDGDESNAPGELWMPRPVRVIDREEVLEWAEQWMDQLEVPEREALREQWDALVDRFLGTTEGAVDEVKDAGRKWINEQRDLLNEVWTGVQELRDEIHTILTESQAETAEGEAEVHEEEAAGEAANEPAA